MESKKVSVFLVVSMVLMATYVSCEIENPPSDANPEAISSNYKRITREVLRSSLSNILLDELEAQNPAKLRDCDGSICSVIAQDCDSGCICLPVALYLGVCG